MTRGLCASTRRMPVEVAVLPSPAKRPLVGKQRRPLWLVEQLLAKRRRLKGKQQPPPWYAAARSQPEKQTAAGGSHYETLGLPFDATGAEIKSAFKQKVLIAHPDRGGSDDAVRAVIAADQVLGKTRTMTMNVELKHARRVL